MHCALCGSCARENIERFIEGQAFSRSYDLAPPSPPPSPVSMLDRRNTGRLRDNLHNGEGGRGLGEEPDHTVALLCKKKPGYVSLWAKVLLLDAKNRVSKHFLHSFNTFLSLYYSFPMPLYITFSFSCLSTYIVLLDFLVRRRWRCRGDKVGERRRYVKEDGDIEINNVNWSYPLRQCKGAPKPPASRTKFRAPLILRLCFLFCALLLMAAGTSVCHLYRADPGS